MPERIRLSRAKGWRKPPNAVVVARPTLWGNPFVVGRDGTAAECVARYVLLASGLIDLGRRQPHPDHQIRALKHIRAQIDVLRGKDLACWCPLNKACHADVLLRLANLDKPNLSVFATALAPSVWCKLESLEALDGMRDAQGSRP